MSKKEIKFVDDTFLKEQIFTFQPKISTLYTSTSKPIGKTVSLKSPKTNKKIKIL